MNESNQYNQQRIIKVASCTLNQWAMDFEGNKNRFISLINIWKEKFIVRSVQLMIIDMTKDSSYITMNGNSNLGK